MKDAVPQYRDGIVLYPETGDQARRRIARCSVCTRRVWFDPIRVVEPDGVPEPRLSWTLCNACHQALQAEIERSPIQSPLRMRIAMGLIAADRWPLAYATRVGSYISDRRWIVFMAVGFFIAMLLHLVLIIMIAGAK